MTGNVGTGAPDARQACAGYDVLRRRSVACSAAEGSLRIQGITRASPPEPQPEWGESVVRLQAVLRDQPVHVVAGDAGLAGHLRDVAAALLEQRHQVLAGEALDEPLFG